MKSFSIYLLLLLLVSFVSCREEIEFDSEWSDPKLVLNAILEDDSSIVAYLARSKKVTEIESNNLNITNGNIEVYQDGNYLTSLTSEGNGRYFSNVQIVSDSEYELRASTPVFDEVRGSTKLAGSVDILEIDSIGTVTADWGWELVVIGITFNDPAQVENYYQIGATYMSSYQIETGFGQYDTVYEETVVYLQYDPNNTEQYIYNGRVNFTDDLFDGKEYQMLVYIDKGSLYGMVDGTIKFTLGNQDEHLFKYTKAIVLQSEAEDLALFAEPVSMYNNIEGGGVGIVGSINNSVDSISLTLEYDDIYYEEFH